MTFKVINHGDVWIVARDGSNIVFPGGTEISYSLYKQLKDAPHQAANHFDLDENGNPVLKPIEQNSPKAHD